MLFIDIVGWQTFLEGTNTYHLTPERELGTHWSIDHIKVQLAESTIFIGVTYNNMSKGYLQEQKYRELKHQNPLHVFQAAQQAGKCLYFFQVIGLVSAAFSLFYFAFRQLLGKKTAYLMLNRKQRENKRGKSGEKSTLQIQIPFEPLPPMRPHLLINAFTSPFMDSSTNGVSTLETQSVGYQDFKHESFGKIFYIQTIGIILIFKCLQ